MPKSRKKKKIIRRRRRPPLPRQEPRQAFASDFLITAGRARAVFEREGKLFIASFPPAEKEPVQAIDCARHAVSMALNFCTGIIAENSAAKPGQPKAIVFHLPPMPRAHEYRGPFAYAEKIVPALLKAMPFPTRVEIIGGHGKGKCSEIQRIEKDLLRNRVKPIIKKENIGGRDPKRWIQLRPQKGKQTVFDYGQNYVLSPKELFTQRGVAKGLSGQELRKYVAENLAGFRQTISGARKAGDKSPFR